MPGSRSPEARRSSIGRARAALGRLHGCERGQAIYVMILFFFLLAGLLFLVLTSGEKLNHKVQMQSAADSAAATGAAWFARGLNVISMCNVAETQLLSLIVLLDTLETVTPPAGECIDDLVENIGSSKAGRDIPIDDRISEWLAVGNAASEQQIIRKLDDIVREIDWPEYLTYDNGVLWECTKLMDGFMHVMREITPLAAQREAIDIADECGADFGFILPLYPELPVRDGEWIDFKNPMRAGRMPPEPGQNPDRAPIIGGFAHVMNYRGYYPDYLYKGEIQHGRGPVMGPWSYWREPFTATRPMGLLDISRFSVLFNLVSSRKLEMLFGTPDPQVSLRNWEMQYDTAKDMSDRDILRTWWETVSFSCRYPYPQDTFFSNLDLRHYHRPTIQTHAYDGWRDLPSPPQSGREPMPGVEQGVSVPQGWQRSTQPQEGADPRQAVWYAVTKHWTYHFPQLGIFAPHPPVHPDGSKWEYTDPSDWKVYYRVQMRRFDGAELDTDEELHRNYLPPGGNAPFAPIMFDLVTGEHTWENIDRYFTFNGFAYRSGKVRHWRKPTEEEGQTTGFLNPNPIEELIAYAQARVYARYSWDLFTQHWKVKLMRTDRWKGGLRPDYRMVTTNLVSELGKSVPGQLADVLTRERIEPVERMVDAYDDQFVAEFTH